MSKIIFFLIIPLAIFSQVRLHDWNNSYYDKYNYSTFQSLAIIHQEIDENNIDYQLLNAAIFYCTNIQRVKYGKKPFIHSPALEKAAQGHSEDMARYDFFSHTSSVRGKRSMSDRLALVGIKNCYTGENVALRKINSSYWNLALSLLDQWMNSSGHKQNILDNNYDYLGCGSYDYIERNYSGTYVKSTQNFYGK